jgi:DNA (cytosine-5)-methyltransferase 1
MIFGSVCSGIEAASVAWHPLGWRAAFLSDIEAFPRAVLAHHYPDVPLRGDFTQIQAGEHEPIGLLVGGTPCQSFSVAGLRGGMDDDRGNLALEFLRLADRLRPQWLVWENVPGVLSSNGGRDFGSILGGMGELGYGVAYRVLDAQFFGVAQRRRRVFVVGYLGDWRRAAAVLFERDCLSGNPSPRRKAREGASGSVGVGASGDGLSTFSGHVPEISPALKARDYKGPSSDGDGDGAPLIAHTLKGEGFDASEDGTGRGTPIVPVAFQPGNLRQGAGAPPSEAVFPTLKSDHGRGLSDQHPHVAVAFNMHKSGNEVSSLGVSEDRTDCLRAFEKSPFAIMQPASSVRRLTPRECERLQGFPDDYTAVPYRKKPAADGPRYKALGNSMAVPVMRWIGERIQAVENLTTVSDASATDKG